MPASRTGVLAAAVAMVVLLATQGALAQLTRDQRSCSDKVNKGARDVAKQEQKADRRCVKDGEGNIGPCVDAESENAAAKRAKLAQLFSVDGRCAVLPPFGVIADPDAIADAVEAGSANNIRAIFGAPPDEVPPDDKCSDKMAQRAGKKYDTILKAFRSCAKGLPAISDVTDLEGCIGPAIAAAATAQAKLDKDVADRCITIPPPGTADGACAGATGAAQLSACIGAQANCQACHAINTFISGNADCDALDDGLANTSCGLRHTCVLGTGSKITLYAGMLTQALTPSGAIDVSCGFPGANGNGPCSCAVQSFAPINFGGAFWACLNAPSNGCPAGTRDCSGGDPLNITVNGRRNLGACSSNNQCRTQCTTFCGGASKVAFAGCEGYCSDGAQMACTTDVQCALAVQGACNGPDGALLGHVCDCTCVNTAAPAARAGAFTCQLGYTLTIEALPGDGRPCDGGTPGDGDVIMVSGDLCAPMTTEFVTSQIANANNMGGVLPATAFNRSGTPLTCNVLDTASSSGLRVVGAEPLFGMSSLGDILAGLELNCQ